MKAVTPARLRSDLIARSRLSLPAMQSLCFLESELSLLPLEWGPGGSVGYKLASGKPVVHVESDLDLVIRAPHRLDRKFAEELWIIFRASPGKVDCRVETQWCGFSLEEYARSETQNLLVRTPVGPFLSKDPWSAMFFGGISE